MRMKSGTAQVSTVTEKRIRLRKVGMSRVKSCLGEPVCASKRFLAWGKGLATKKQRGVQDPPYSFAQTVGY